MAVYVYLDSSVFWSSCIIASAIIMNGVMVSKAIKASYQQPAPQAKKTSC